MQKNLAGVFLPRVEGEVSGMCAHIGGMFLDGSFSEPRARWNYDNYKPGYFSLGSKIFATTHAHALDAGGLGTNDEVFKPPPRDGKRKGCMYTQTPRTDKTGSGFSLFVFPCPDRVNQPVGMHIHAVQEKSANGNIRTLSGWLHIKIELLTPGDEIEWAYVQMRDEDFNAIGEFVKNPEDQCPSSSTFVSPSVYQYLPCTAVGRREAALADAIFMARRSQLVSSQNQRYLSNQDLKTGIHFTWRYSEYWCNRHFRIRADVYILTKKNKETHDAKQGLPASDRLGYRLLRKTTDYWLQPAWFGAADIRRPGSTLVCDNSVINWSNGIVNTNHAPWIKPEGIVYRWKDDIYHQLYLSSQKRNQFSCQVTLETPNKTSFGGRCTHMKRQGASRDQLHWCNLNSNSPEFQGLDFPTHGNYYHDIAQERSKFCTQDCKIPETEQDAAIISEYPRRPSGWTSAPGESYNISTTEHVVLRFFRGRKYHGSTAIIATMLFTPISIFSARYYKETFMESQSFGCHIWYWIHIVTTLGSCALYLTSLSALTVNIATWGRSLSQVSRLHTLIGWISHSLFLLMGLLGGLRNTSMHILIMTIHSLLGFINYFLNLAAIILSTSIPGSPSLEMCDDTEGYPTGVSSVAVVTVVWICLDVIFHVALTVIQCFGDKHRSIVRGWWCPIIPILPFNSLTDMKGSGLRKVLMFLYIFFCALCTFLAVIFLVQKELPDNCLFGPMTCDPSVYPYGCTKMGKLIAAALRAQQLA